MASEVDMIFPIGWQSPKNANNLSKMNKKYIKEDKQIVNIDNLHNVFDGVAGAEWTNIVMWKKDYDNHLSGKQLVYTNGKDPKKVKLVTKKNDVDKPIEITELSQLVKKHFGFEPLQKITSVLKPYGLRTDVPKDPSKYQLPSIQDERFKKDDLELWTGGRGGRKIKYVPKNYPFPRVSEALHSYKVLVPYAWGNWSESAGLGGAYSDIIIAFPNVATTETWQESGNFTSLNIAKKHAKYLMTKFVRALLYVNKFSQHSTTAWGAVPIQDYSEDWWELSISEINEKLFDKYHIPNEIRKFVNDNIQDKNESNIVNFK
ncbi:hypothetical protein EQU06_07090 [Lactobacillus sanfranciscensis]|nr:hypothetical protein [Fructilactobacillus sanfranciscensis]NDR76550.1 hypothetical protein [Fructilactobacillus sanfranciscensis]NDS05082.1 hypothetical protein [Fructilactobacillus sanfranciscensis]POH17112.1 hypothetical protein BGL44_06815 [Fructilactobacillus sanfranciscensis]POH20864.1 hypothetical protein BGL47_06665 [Fructilactobacillus sanfranciscensis]